MLEDADCLTNLVCSREYRDKEEKEKEEDKDDELYFEKNMAKKMNADNPANMSDFLNILDGILEIEGRIIIMTTNYVERIDSALKRPGRFDSIIHFKNCSSQTIREMFEHIFGFPPSFATEQYDRVFTPAQIQEILLRNLDSPMDVKMDLEQFIGNGDRE